MWKIERRKSGVLWRSTESLAYLKRGDGLEVHRVDDGCSWLNMEDRERLASVDTVWKKTISHNHSTLPVGELKEGPGGPPLGLRYGRFSV